MRKRIVFFIIVCALAIVPVAITAIATHSDAIGSIVGGIVTFLLGGLALASGRVSKKVPGDSTDIPTDSELLRRHIERNEKTIGGIDGITNEVKRTIEAETDGAASVDRQLESIKSGIESTATGTDSLADAIRKGIEDANTKSKD